MDEFIYKQIISSRTTNMWRLLLGIVVRFETVLESVSTHHSASLNVTLISVLESTKAKPEHVINSIRCCELRKYEYVTITVSAVQGLSFCVSFLSRVDKLNKLARLSVYGSS